MPVLVYRVNQKSQPTFLLLYGVKCFRSTVLFWYISTLKYWILFEDCSIQWPFSRYPSFCCFRRHLIRILFFIYLCLSVTSSVWRQNAILINVTFNTSSDTTCITLKSDSLYNLLIETRKDLLFIGPPCMHVLSRTAPFALVIGYCTCPAGDEMCRAVLYLSMRNCHYRPSDVHTV